MTSSSRSSPTMLTMRVANMPHQKLAYTNRVYVSSADFEGLKK